MKFSPVILLITVVSMFTALNVHSHRQANGPDTDNDSRKIRFPDTKNYKTLSLDPHTHSVFSDGHVWPTLRVSEALYDGLDAMAITEHLEYQPHLADLPHPDRNRSFEIASQANEGNDLILIPGSEITRRGPAGHINALFITDANKLLNNYVPEDPSDTLKYYETVTKWPAQDAVDAANEQGAFLFWNHSWWGSDFPNNIVVAPEFHISNAKNQSIHGIEIANGNNYSEEAFQIALDLNLTLIGVSDIHELIDWDYKPHEGGHRPVTLVLAKERTMESIREALFAGRTVVWFKNLLIARKNPMKEILEVSLSIVSATYSGTSDVLQVEIENRSDSDFYLKNTSDYTFSESADILKIAQHGTTKVKVKTGKRLKKVELKFEVLNTLVKPKQHAKINLSTKIVVLD